MDPLTYAALFMRKTTQFQTLKKVGLAASSISTPSPNPNMSTMTQNTDAEGGLYESICESRPGG